MIERIVLEYNNKIFFTYRIDAEDIKRQVNLFGAIGVSVALIAGCAFVAFMALVYALQPSTTIVFSKTKIINLMLIAYFRCTYGNNIPLQWQCSYPSKK